MDVASERTPPGSIFGDAVFETMLVYRNRIHLLDLHLKRLGRGASVLGLDCDTRAIRKDLMECLQGLESDESCYRLRLVLQRKLSLAGYSVAKLPVHWLISRTDTELPRFEELSATLSSITLASQPNLAGIKHANRLEQILARRVLEATPHDEAIMLDREGWVIECIASNIYILEGDSIFTPRLDESGVAGVAREWLRQNVESLSLCFEEQQLSQERCIQADAVFVSNAISGFRQITAYSGAQLGRSWSSHPAINAIQARFIDSVRA